MIEMNYSEHSTNCRPLISKCFAYASSRVARQAEVATMIDSTPPAVRQMQVRAVSALRAAMERPLPETGT